MNLESWILIFALLAMVVFRQLGERKFTIRIVIVQFLVLGYFTYKYVNGVPTGGSNTIILISTTLIGLLLGALMLIATKVYYKNGARYVKSGIPYLILWIIGLGSKVLIAEYITKWNIHGSTEFIIRHHINPNVISTSFMFLTIAMILVRTIGIYIIFALKKDPTFTTVSN